MKPIRIQSHKKLPGNCCAGWCKCFVAAFFCGVDACRHHRNTCDYVRQVTTIKAHGRVVAVLIAGVFAISGSAASLEAAPLFFAGTGHHYDFVSGSFTWEAAKTDAETLSFMGMPGHLATITSSDEDSFIRTNFSTEVAQFVGPWLGAVWNGAGSGPTGGWSWVTGESFSYTGWNNGEPNHLGGEDALHFSGGGWNDIHRTRTDSIGYFVEYVPEPYTFALATLGLLGLVAHRKRRRACNCSVSFRSTASRTTPSWKGDD